MVIPGEQCHILSERVDDQLLCINLGSSNGNLLPLRVNNVMVVMAFRYLCMLNGVSEFNLVIVDRTMKFFFVTSRDVKILRSYNRCRRLQICNFNVTPPKFSLVKGNLFEMRFLKWL